MALLKYCVNSRPTYITRNVHPSLRYESLLDFDNKVDDLLAYMIRCELPEVTKQLRGLPIYMSGLALTRHSGPAGMEAYRNRCRLVIKFTRDMNWNLVTQHLEYQLQDLHLLNRTGVGTLISENEMQNRNSREVLQQIATQTHVKTIMDISSIPGLDKKILTSNETEDDNSNFTDSLEEAYSTIQVAIIRNFIEEYVKKRKDMRTHERVTVAKGIFRTLTEDHGYVIVQDPAILLKKLHFLISGCYVKEDDSTKFSLSGIVFNYHGGNDGRKRMDDFVFSALLKSRLLLPSTPISCRCPCSQEVDLSKDSTHGLCCRKENHSESTKRSAKCEYALIETAMGVVKEFNESHRIAASSSSAATRLQDLQMSVHHGNSLGKTYYRPSTRIHDTLVEVQPDLVIRITGNNNIPLEDILFDVTIREPTQKLVIEQSLKQAIPVKFGHASVIGWKKKKSQYAQAVAKYGEAHMPVTVYPIVIESNGAILKESVNSLEKILTLGDRIKLDPMKAQSLRRQLAYAVATSNGLMLDKATRNSTRCA